MKANHNRAIRSVVPARDAKELKLKANHNYKKPLVIKWGDAKELKLKANHNESSGSRCAGLMQKN